MMGERKQRCSSHYKLPVIKAKAAILLIVWNILVQANARFLIMSVFDIDYIVADDKTTADEIIFPVTRYSLSVILYPLLSWLADVRTGRFAMLVVGQAFYWISKILLLPAFFMAIFIRDAASDNALIIVLLLLSLCIVTHEVASASHNSNIAQFVMDHMVGSSAE